VLPKTNKVYNPHETERMAKLHGAPLASFRSRAGAFVVDFILTLVVFMLLAMFGAWLAPQFGFPVGDVHLTFDFTHWYSLIFLVVYFTLWTYFTDGRSPGKRLFGIRVVSLVHDHLTLWQSFERSLGYGASALEGGFGFLQFFIHPDRRTVHDRIAETIVVTDRPVRTS